MKSVNLLKFLIVLTSIIIVVTIVVQKINVNRSSINEMNISKQVDDSIKEIQIKNKTIEDIVNEFGGEIKQKVKEDTCFVQKEGKDYTIYLDGDICKGNIIPWDGTSKMPRTDENGNICIYESSELKWIADQVIIGTENYSNKRIVLKNNIDLGARKLSDEKWDGIIWTPIVGFLNEDSVDNNEIKSDNNIEITQENLKRFAGEFDGNGFWIRGLYIDSNKRYQGLFGYQTGTISNIEIKNSYINGSDSVGAIVALNDGILNNCKITNVSVNGKEKVGGLVGNSMTNSQIINCYTENENIVQGEKYIGGIVGYSNSNTTITETKNNCIVIGKEYVGGISGIAYLGSSISNSSNISNSITGKEYVGGLIGYSQATINKSYNQIVNKINGEVKGLNYVGGLVGVNYINGLISNSYNSGKIICELDNCGGIAGLNNSNISNCYNAGTIDAAFSNGIKIGGICGQNISESNINDSYSIGRIDVKVKCNGIVGANFGSKNNCYYLDTSVPSRINKTEEARSEEFMKNEIVSNLGENYKNDTKNINSGFPILTWQEEN